MQDSTKQTPELLTIPQAARELGITARSLWGWISAGRIPVVRLSRRATRIRRVDLDRFVDSCTDHGKR